MVRLDPPDQLLETIDLRRKQPTDLRSHQLEIIAKLEHAAGEGHTGVTLLAQGEGLARNA